MGKGRIGFDEPIQDLETIIDELDDIYKRENGEIDIFGEQTIEDILKGGCSATDRV